MAGAVDQTGALPAQAAGAPQMAPPALTQ
jgi:hypothetical protein